MSEKLSILLFTLLLVLSYMVAINVRTDQLNAAWGENPEHFYVKKTPMVNTLDAYYWGRMAEEYAEGRYKGDTDPLMYYPDGHPRYKPVPLLSFILVYAFILVVTLFFHKQKYSTITFATLIYLLLSGPRNLFTSVLNFIDLAKSYIFSKEQIVGGFPNVYRTVSEASQGQAGEIISFYFMHPVFFFLGMAGLALLFIRQWRNVIPLLPILGLGLLVFITSSRFVMYLIPLWGVGLGYIICAACDKLPVKAKALKPVASYVLVIAFVLTLFVLGPHVRGFIFYKFMPMPSISVEQYSSFISMKDMLPENSAIYTWWDYGLAIEAATGFATFHDGMNQNTLKTWLIARSFVDDQDDMYKHIAYISNNGVKDLLTGAANRTISARQLLEDIDSYTAPLDNDRVYIVFTRDLLQKYGAIQYIGNWDVLNSRFSESVSPFEAMDCAHTYSSTISCGQITVDIKLGLINQKYPVKSIDYVDPRTGRRINKFETGLNSQYHLIAVKNGDVIISLFLMDEIVYNSSFVQLYLLGNYNPELYEEVASYFPYLRVYHVKGGTDINETEPQ